MLDSPWSTEMRVDDYERHTGCFGLRLTGSAKAVEGTSSSGIRKLEAARLKCPAQQRGADCEARTDRGHQDETALLQLALFNGRVHG